MFRYSPLLFLAACVPAFADHTAKQPNGEPTALLLPGLGDHHHSVSTKVAEAQKFFDQGLTLLYAFNHDEARRSFARAAELDPTLAMAYWGQAISLGPNYNLDANDTAWKAAYAALQTAMKLAPQAPEPERDYIHALAKRYGPDPKADRKPLAIAYKEAMGELAKKYPDDLDAATLYAESAMNLRPWKLWTPDGQPAEGTLEIVATLESVLRRNPDHPGANHYYIHAIEASPHPERGLAAANRLGPLAPAAGHLVHMPSHIYMRVGDYAAAAEANARAAEADEAYIRRRNPTGPYPMMYYPHNLHFLAIAHCFQGRYEDAKQAGERLAKQVGHHVKDMPMLEGFLVAPIMVEVRFNKWDEILQLPEPDCDRPLTKAARHFARGLAFLAKGETDKGAAERAAFDAALKEIPEDAPFSDMNRARHIFGIAEKVLDSKLALAAKDRAKAIALLREAVKLEDQLNYGEPPDWFLPVRETLGSTLLLGGDAAEAEKVFRDGLKQYRRSGRCLFGLAMSLKEQGNEYSARLVDQQFRAAWKNTDSPRLRLEGF